MPEALRACASCTWWQRSGPKLANASRDPSASPMLGVCHFNPPVVVNADSAFPVPLAPETHETWFCSRWQNCDGGAGGGERTVVAFKPKEAA